MRNNKYKKVLVEDFYWVVSFTKSYEELFDNLFESIKKYSNRKCIVYSINYDYVLPLDNSENDQFITKRIDIPEGDKDNRGRDNNIISSKPVINLNVLNHFPNKKFVTIDSDIYFTTNSDSIIKYFDELENYPLINSHIHEVIYLRNIVPDQEWTSSLHLLLDEMRIQNFVIPRRKTNILIFDKRSEWFFKEQMEIYDKYKGTKPGILAFHDEDTANAVLSKYKLDKCLPLIDIENSYTIDIDKFIDTNHPFHFTQISEWVKLPKNKNEVLFFHGVKSKEYYDSISENYGKTVLESEEMNISYENNTILFDKNFNSTNKNLPEKVDFKIYNGNSDLIFSFNEQLISQYFLFYVNNLYLPKGLYIIKILNSLGGDCIFNDIIEII
jgi:hypothetical protein